MEITKKMIIDPTQITKEVKNNIKSWAKGCKFAVIYLHHSYDNGYHITENFGYPIIEDYSNGPVTYECVDAFKTQSEAIRHAKLVKQCTNKKFTNVSIIEL